MYNFFKMQTYFNISWIVYNLNQSKEELKTLKAILTIFVSLFAANSMTAVLKRYTDSCHSK